jgi:acyl carrier protein
MSDVLGEMCRFLDGRTGAIIDCISGDDTFVSLDIDSLVLTEMAVSLERRFGIEVPDGVLRPDQTVGEAAGLVASRYVGH